MAMPTIVTDSPRLAPQRTTTTLADITPMSEPAPMANSRMPTSKSSIARFCLTAGSRDAQDAKVTPHRRNSVKIEVRQRTSWRRSRREREITPHCIHISRIDSMPRRRACHIPDPRPETIRRGLASGTTNRRATIADVARVAGVSPSTASVVFSGKTPVSDTTRLRVIEAADSSATPGPTPRRLAAPGPQRHRRRRRRFILNFMFVDPVQRLLMDGSPKPSPLGAGLLLRRDAELDIENAPTLTTASIDAAVLIGCDGRCANRCRSSRPAASPSSSSKGTPARAFRASLDNREAQRRAASTSATSATPRRDRHPAGRGRVGRMARADAEITST
jgi:hypothetical protein